MNTSGTEIGIGVVGGGYMGKAHSVAMASVGAVFETTLRPRLEVIAARSDETGQRYASAYGFSRGTGDWRSLVDDPKVDAVIIASPQDTHLEIALAALAVGKPVMCEKPLGLNVDQAREMVKAADAAAVANMVAYNYSRTPATQFVRKMIADGAIGQIVSFRCEHMEDFASAAGLAEWRYHGEANGCLGDLAPHPINAALSMMGPIEEVNALIERVDLDRGDVTVTNDDQVQMMVRFANGVSGHIAASRVASGRKMGYAYEIFGSTGAIRFDQEDQNAVWLYRASDQEAERGFRKILTGPAHPDYLPFCQGPGHGTGYQDQIIIEAHDFLKAIDTGEAVWPTFQDGLDVQQVIAAARESSKTRTWQSTTDF